MKRTEPGAWSRFLDADREGRDGESEAALRELFRELPDLRPAPGFAARVMARLPRRRSLFAHPAARLALAAALVAAAISGGLLLPALLPIASWIGPGGFIELVLAGFLALLDRFVAGLALWEPVGVALRAIGRALVEPRLLALLLSQFLLAAAALRGLVGLSRRQRSSLHVVS